jgi:hypothetical protein
MTTGTAIPEHSDEAKLAEAADLAKRGYAMIATDCWQPDPDRAGYLRYVCQRTIREVVADLRRVLGEYPVGGEEYFTASKYGRRGEEITDWPKGRIAVFAVRGSNEGDYVHIEVIHEGESTIVALAKTFQGRDAAWTFARHVADLLGV